MTLWRQTRNIHLSIPEEILAEVDELTKSMFLSRSDCIRQILLKEIQEKRPQIDNERRISNSPRPTFYDLDDS